jgi:hypothetical protein
MDVLKMPRKMPKKYPVSNLDYNPLYYNRYRYQIIPNDPTVRYEICANHMFTNYAFFMLTHNGRETKFLGYVSDDTPNSTFYAHINDLTKKN